MSANVPAVEYEEALSIKVAKFIKEKGYVLASCSGRESSYISDEGHIGIIQNNPNSKPVKNFFGFIKDFPRRVFIGVIWLNNSPREADEKNWVFEFRGRQNIDIVKQLAEELSKTFEVKIKIRLIGETNYYESRLGDYSW